MNLWIILWVISAANKTAPAAVLCDIVPARVSPLEECGGEESAPQKSISLTAKHSGGI
jgi:hypothetical protein